MNTHTITSLTFFKQWKRKRMLLFNRLINPKPTDILIDVGGYPGEWTYLPQIPKRIDCLNIHPIGWSEESAPNHHITTVVGNGCALDYPDNHYDILYSNSVIEHVGEWERQCDFASEVRRVGKKIWIQTPAFSCPIEPHFFALFVHWLPIRVRRIWVRWLTPWGWLNRPSQKEADRLVYEIHLLTKRQVRELFPDCKILTEKLLWILPKSYIAYRP